MENKFCINYFTNSKKPNKNNVPQSGRQNYAIPFLPVTQGSLYFYMFLLSQVREHLNQTLRKQSCLSGETMYEGEPPGATWLQEVGLSLSGFASRH